MYVAACVGFHEGYVSRKP